MQVLILMQLVSVVFMNVTVLVPFVCLRFFGLQTLLLLNFHVLQVDSLLLFIKNVDFEDASVFHH